MEKNVAEHKRNALEGRARIKTSPLLLVRTYLSGYHIGFSPCSIAGWHTWTTPKRRRGLFWLTFLAHCWLAPRYDRRNRWRKTAHVLAARKQRAKEGTGERDGLSVVTHIPGTHVFQPEPTSLQHIQLQIPQQMNPCRHSAQDPVTFQTPQLWPLRLWGDHPDTNHSNIAVQLIARLFFFWNFTESFLDQIQESYF